MKKFKIYIWRQADDLSLIIDCLTLPEIHICIVNAKRRSYTWLHGNVWPSILDLSDAIYKDWMPTRTIRALFKFYWFKNILKILQDEKKVIKNITKLYICWFFFSRWRKDFKVMFLLSNVALGFTIKYLMYNIISQFSLFFVTFLWIARNDSDLAEGISLAGA